MLKKITLVALLTLSPILFAASAAQQLASLLKHTKNVKADFVQTVYGDHQTILSKSSGYFILQQPGKFYWMIDKPMKQVIVNDGDKMWQYQPLLEQVIVKPVNKAVQATPLAILGGSSAALEQGFVITRQNKNTFQLKAKKQGTFSYVWLYFTKNVISGMKLQDALGQSTRLRFSKVTSNVKVPASKFKFIPPKGVDVIKSM